MEFASEYDVIVVGGGNAALCAALSAAETGAKVLVLERAPEEERGGNTAFSEGLMRFAYRGTEDILALSPDLSEEEKAADFGAYTENDFFADMAEVTENRTDPELCEILVKESNATVHWLKNQGLRFLPQFGRQSFKVGGRHKFWGGATLAVSGGGRGMVDALFKVAEKKGVKTVYNAWVRDLLELDERVCGVKARIDGRTRTFRAQSVVLACGGFEANTEWRAKYLGPGWDLAKVRGTRYNSGDGLAMALKIGAQPRGNWSGCHAVGWERYADDFGDLNVADDYERDSYPFSIMVNSEGKRFLDEGADIRNYTYAKYGHIIMRQPGRFAWQIFDSSVSHLLRPEYRARRVTKVTADTIEQLAVKLEDVNTEQLLKTIREFNKAVKSDVPFNPTIKDGRGTVGLDIPKSNWAIALENPPFQAFSVTCGITFTFGGLAITAEGQVVNGNGVPIPGLYAAGEMVGGLYYFNYPGSTGLTSGAVFGRLAGRNAALAALAALAAQTAKESG